jgi:transcriptional regulator with XRE-family HTH domain
VREPANLTARGTVQRIAAAMRRRRAELGMTQNDLAEVIGLDRQYVTGLESGRAVRQLERLVTALNGLGLELVVVPRGHPLANEQRTADAPVPRRVDHR